MKTGFLRLTVALAAAVVPAMGMAQEAGVTISVDSGAFIFSPANKKGYWGGLHPNPRAHATFAARIIPQLTPYLPSVETAVP